MSKWPRYSKSVDTWYQVQAWLCETKTARYQEGPTLQVMRMPWSVGDQRKIFFSSEKHRTGISSTSPVDERYHRAGQASCTTPPPCTLIGKPLCYHRASQALCTTPFHFRRSVAATTLPPGRPGFMSVRCSSSSN